MALFLKGPIKRYLSKNMKTDSPISKLWKEVFKTSMLFSGIFILKWCMSANMEDKFINLFSITTQKIKKLGRISIWTGWSEIVWSFLRTLKLLIKMRLTSISQKDTGVMSSQTVASNQKVKINYFRQKLMIFMLIFRKEQFFLGTNLKKYKTLKILSLTTK